MDIRMMKREIYGYLEGFLLSASLSRWRVEDWHELIRDVILGNDPTDASTARFERAKAEVAAQLGEYSIHRKWKTSKKRTAEFKKEIEEWNRKHGTDGPKS